MALVDDILKGFDGGLTGIAVGIGTALLAPIFIPVLAESSKSLTKAAIKEGILAYEKSQEAIASVTDVFENIVAEAKAEIAQKHHKDTQSKAVENNLNVVSITD